MSVATLQTELGSYILHPLQKKMNFVSDNTLMFVHGLIFAKYSTQSSLNTLKGDCKLEYVLCAISKLSTLFLRKIV